MKKILLGTTALIGAATLFASAARAEGPAVTLGGFLNFQAGYADQDSGFRTGTNSRDVKFQNNSKVDVKVDGKSDNGLGYGAVIELESDVTADANNGGLNADRTYVYLESNAGRVELGSQVSPAKTMRVDASTFSHGTGGVDGDFYYYVNTTFANLASSAAYGGGFITSPDLPLDGGNALGQNSTENANKIIYYTPRAGGFQFGVSYAPDSGNRGTASGFTTDADVGQAQNVFDLGLNYTGQYDQIGVAASATGSFGDAESAATNDLRAYAFGLNATFKGFTAGGSYGHTGDSLQPTTATGGGKFWDAGLGYETGPFGVSVSYFDSKLNDNKFTNTVVGADYKLAPGLVPYVEVNFFDLNPTGAAASNSGTAVLAGTQLNF